MLKGAPILRSAVTGKLRLELTYRDPFAKERTDELQTEERALHNIELSTASECDTSESLQLTMPTSLPELSPELLCLLEEYLKPSSRLSRQQIERGAPAEIQHTMHANVLQSESYPLISFYSTRIEKTGVNHWLVTGELRLHGQSIPILADSTMQEEPTRAVQQSNKLILALIQSASGVAL